MLRCEPFAWVLRGVYIGLPPGGTMVIRWGTGPSRQSLWPPSYPPTPGARRLVGPADWLGVEPTGRVRHGRVLPAADYCSRASNDPGSVMRSWRQLRRLVGDHRGHYLVDRPAPPPRVLSAAAYCCRASDDEGFVVVSMATVLSPGGLLL